MAISMQSGTATRIAVSVPRFLARIAAKSHAALKALQIARMQSTLLNMSDYQLTQIGVSRSDIPKYAETLMADK